MLDTAYVNFLDGAGLPIAISHGQLSGFQGLAMDVSERTQAIRATAFWAGLEYMNLPQAPDVDERRNIFRIEEEADLPWVHPRRKAALSTKAPKKFKAQIAYCGIIDKRDYTVALRALLGLRSLEAREMQRSGDAATVLIPLDDTGRICGEVFVSSLPWFMGRLAAHRAKNGSQETLDLCGFDAYQEDLMIEVRRLLVQLQLIRDEDVQRLEQQAGHDKVDKQAVQQGRGGADNTEAAVVPALVPTPTASMTDGRIAGPLDMRPLELVHVQQLLNLIWKRAEWKPTWGPYAAADGEKKDTTFFSRIKVITLTRHIDRVIDLGAMNSLVANDVLRIRGRLVSNVNRPGYRGGSTL